MNCTSVLAELKACGSAQTRKTYARHGIGLNMFGVSYAHLGRLQKKIKTDHELALALWASGNHDARVLATMIGDPARVDARLADAWVKELDNCAITDAFTGLIGRNKLARKRIDKWIASKGEWICRAGWNLVARAALYDDDLDDAYFAAWLPRIEAGIHTAANRARDAMNSALIAIGVRNAQLCKLALASAKRIGKVEVDQGDTSCKTRDASEYIQKTLARRRAVKKKPAAKFLAGAKGRR